MFEVILHQTRIGPILSFSASKISRIWLGLRMKGPVFMLVSRPVAGTNCMTIVSLSFLHLHSSTITASWHVSVPTVPCFERLPWQNLALVLSFG